jgi:hypothetical protein
MQIKCKTFFLAVKSELLGSGSPALGGGTVGWDEVTGGGDVSQE